MGLLDHAIFNILMNCLTICMVVTPFYIPISHAQEFQFLHVIIIIILKSLLNLLCFQGGSVVKNLPAIQKIQVRSLGQENPLEEGMVPHSSILAWKIPWREEPGGLQSKGLPRVGHN